MPTTVKRLPLLDWDNGPMKNEHYGTIRDLYRKYPDNRAIGQTVAKTLAKAPYAENAVYSTLPKLGFITNRSTDDPSLVSMVLQRWPHFNNFPLLPYINTNTRGVAEELMHAMDWLADSPLSARRDYQQAVKAGNQRLYDHGSDAAKHMFMDNLYQDKDVPVNNDWAGIFGPHGKVMREITNAVSALGSDDFTNERFLYGESVPRLMLADPDTAQKYYPEAMRELQSFFNEFPASDDDLTVRFNVNLAK